MANINNRQDTRFFEQFLLGVKAGLPVAIGYIPIAAAFGVIAIKARLSPSESVLMSTLVFAGASQFMAASMMLNGMDGVQIVIATLFINFRHLIMSMAFHSRLEDANTPWRALLSFGITDETFAILTLQTAKPNTSHTRFFAIGVIGAAYSGWIVGTAVGSLGAQVIPPSVGMSLEIGLYAMFIALLMPHVRHSWRVAFIAGTSMMLNAVLSSIMSIGWAIVISTALGAMLGLLTGETE